MPRYTFARIPPGLPEILSMALAKFFRSAVFIRGNVEAGSGKGAVGRGYLGTSRWKRSLSRATMAL